MIIQWGKANKTGVSGSDRIITVTGLLFTQEPMVVFSPYFSSGNSNDWYPDITAISSSSFTVNTRRNIDNVPIRWSAIGY